MELKKSKDRNMVSTLSRDKLGTCENFLDVYRNLDRGSILPNSSLVTFPRFPSPSRQEDDFRNCLPPLLRLSPEIRLEIFRTTFREILIAVYGLPKILLKDVDIPWIPSIKPPVRGLLLVNKLIHAEAEEALWKNFTVIVHAFEQYKYPHRPSPFLGLGAYAYGVIRRVDLPLHVERDSNFTSVKIYCNGAPGSAKTGTWKFENVIRKLTALQHANILIFGCPDLVSSKRFRKQALGILSDMLAVLSAKTILVIVDKEGLREDLEKEIRYRVGKAKKIEWQVEDMDQWRPKESFGSGRKQTGRPRPKNVNPYPPKAGAR